MKNQFRTQVIVMSLIVGGVFGMSIITAKKSLAYEITAEEVIERIDTLTDDNPRSQLRAFYTAPPVIPHSVESRNPQDCLRCHAQVTPLDDGRIAMATPHPQFFNCQQCHVQKDMTGKDQVENNWVGLKEPQYGERWSGVSPPTVPHRIFLREKCLSCHSSENPNQRLRTPHPERSACLQCHVPDASKEF